MKKFATIALAVVLSMGILMFFDMQTLRFSILTTVCSKRIQRKASDMFPESILMVTTPLAHIPLTRRQPSLTIKPLIF